MKGTYRIIVKNATVRYDFEIRRNITVLQGDSATGKTTLLELINDYYELGPDSGIELTCDVECAVVGGRDWKTSLIGVENRIIFIDEGNSFVLSDEFASLVKNSTNYYVIVSREGLPNLPYSVEEIYGIRTSGKYGSIKQVYNEFYHIYGDYDVRKSKSPATIVCEDSNSGYEFWHNVCPNKEVISANGKSNIFDIVSDIEDSCLIIADGAAFGTEIGRLSKLLQHKKNIVIYLPESFEWLLLSAGVIQDTKINEILINPADYIYSENYFSWERFFTGILVEATKGTHKAYSKAHLNSYYLNNIVQNSIKEKIIGIEL